MKAVTAEVMQGLDRQTIMDYGVPGFDLMARAGANVAGIIKSRFSSSGNRALLILSGKGNNGGDGFVVARLLAESGWQVILLLFAATDSFSGDAKAHYDLIPSMVKQVRFEQLAHDEFKGLIHDSAVVVDALFGTGLKNGLTGAYAAAAGCINSCSRPVLAVDIPSGVNATSGQVPGDAIKADITVTFGAAKLGQFLYPGAGYVGELIVTDIGIPAELLANAPFVEIVDEPYAAGLVIPRNKTVHKGGCGHCLVIAGSCGKSGAATMAANSAMRSGAGLVTLAVPSGIHTVVEVKTTEVMTVPLPETSQGTLAAGALAGIEVLLTGRDVAAVGPGLGGHAETAALVRGIVSAARVPLVLDADALNVLANDLHSLRNSSSPALILTPHPGEMARLAGATVAAVEADRITAATGFATANKCYLLLKGARTVIAAPDGRLAINGNGNPGMASGGMGDVLTGVITALLGQGYEPFAACCLGAFCHGLAGDMAAAEKGETGLVATDVQEMLPYAFKRLAGK